MTRLIPKEIDALDVSPEVKRILAQIHRDVTLAHREEIAKLRAALDKARRYKHHVVRWSARRVGGECTFSQHTGPMTRAAAWRFRNTIKSHRATVSVRVFIVRRRAK